MKEIEKLTIHVFLISLLAFLKQILYIIIYTFIIQTVGVGQSRPRSHSLEVLKRKFSFSLEKDDYQPLGGEV